MNARNDEKLPAAVTQLLLDINCYTALDGGVGWGVLEVRMARVALGEGLSGYDFYSNFLKN